MTTRLVVREKRSDQGLIVLDGQCTDRRVRSWRRRSWKCGANIRQQRQAAEHRLEGLIERCQGLEPLPTGVVHPCTSTACRSVGGRRCRVDSSRVLRSRGRVRRIAEAARLDIAKFESSPGGPEDSAFKAAMAAGSGELATLMKGSLHTDVLLHAVLQKETKLRIGRLISHCTMVSAPTTRAASSSATSR